MGNEKWVSGCRGEVGAPFGLGEVGVGWIAFRLMSERAEHWEYFQDLYRFAFVLTEDEDRAMRAVTASLEDALKRPRSHGDLDRLLALLFKEVRGRVLKDAPGAPDGRRAKGSALPEGAVAGVEAGDLVAVRTAIYGLPEPGRSALALLYLDVAEAEEIQRILGVTERDLAKLLEGARAELHGALAK